MNPFLHLSLPLAVAEQVSIDQPPGIRSAYQTLRARVGDHQAAHAILDAWVPNLVINSDSCYAAAWRRCMST